MSCKGRKKLEVLTGGVLASFRFFVGVPDRRVLLVDDQLEPFGIDNGLSTTHTDSLNCLVQQLLVPGLVQPASESSRQLSLRDVLGPSEITGVPRGRHRLGLRPLGGDMLAYSITDVSTVGVRRISDERVQLVIHHRWLDVHSKLLQSLKQ